MVGITQGTVALTGVDIIDFGISDTEICTTASGTFLYALSENTGSVIAYQIMDDGTLQANGIQTVTGSYSSFASGAIHIVDGDAACFAVVGHSGGHLVGFEIQADGTLAASETILSTLDVVAFGLSEGTSGDYVYIGSDDAILQYATSDVRTGQEMSTITTETGQGVTGIVEIGSTGGNAFISYGADSNDVTAFVVDATTGNLIQGGTMGASLGLGLNTITDVVHVPVAGNNFGVIAGFGSSSLSVVSIDETGDITAVDHVLDSLNTRFENVTSLETITVDGHAYIIAGGGDGGLSLFTMLPNGQLVYLNSIADTTSIGLQNVVSISAVLVGDAINVFVTSQTDGGITQLFVSVADLGDMIVAAGDSAVLSGTAQDDTLSGGDGADTFHAGAGDDVLYDGAGQDQLSGEGGQDLFIMAEDGALDTILDFERGVDLLDLSGWSQLYDFGQLTVSSTYWGAIVAWKDEVLHIYSDDGLPLSLDDILNAELEGISRPPLLLSFDSTDDGYVTALYGEAGDDTLEADFASLIYAGAGNDYVVGSTQGDGIHGEAGDDTIFGGDGNDKIYGGLDADTVHGGNGDDTVWGGNGRDTVYLNVGNDTFWDNDQTGFLGVDTVFGGFGNDTINGGGGDDILHGQIDDDTIYGGDGADKIYGGTGADVLTGGNGDDTVWGGNGRDTVQLGNGNDTFWDNGQTGFWGVDTVFGGQGHDGINGGGGDDIFHGEAGDDTIFGGDGADQIYGGLDADTLHGGNGDDMVWGGNGRDTVYLNVGNDTFWDNDQTGFLGVDTVFGGFGNDTINGGGGDDILHGEMDDDVISGGDGADQIYGGTGTDTIFGGTGNDTVWGGNGRDTVQLGNGNDTFWDNAQVGFWAVDTVSGGAGDDTFYAGGGDDVFTGGDGRDTFHFSMGDDRDTITDFESGYDEIVLDGTNATQFGDLIINTEGTDLIIDYGGGVVVLSDMTLADVSVDDFIFIV